MQSSQGNNIHALHTLLPFTLQTMHKPPPNIFHRRGAALIVALVLLTVFGLIAGMVLPQIVRSRQAMRMDLVRIQSRQLLDDALRRAEVQRESDPEFSGETLTLGREAQPFPGTFQVTTRLVENSFAGEVVYRDGSDRTLLHFSHEPAKEHAGETGALAGMLIRWMTEPTPSGS